MRKLILVSLAILSVLLIACAKQELVIQTKQSAEGGEMPAKTTATSYPQPQETSEQTKSEEFAEGKIPQIKYCPIEYALGYKAGSCEVSEGKLKLTFKAVGEPVSGVAFSITGKSGEIIYLKESTNLEKEIWKTYVFNMSELETNLDGPISDVIVMPLKDVDGQEKACTNQRLLVISEQVCRI